MNQHQKMRLEAALQYAARGWKVIPVGRDKKPINHNGSRGSTNDTKQIIDWWTQHPFANIGVTCGPESFWVVDVDMKKGNNGWKALQDHFGDRLDFKIEQYLWQKTPTGGFHFLFQWPQDIVVPNPAGILPGIDIRGDGGYIVVAPSALQIEGKFIQYRWNNGALPISPITGWAAELLSISASRDGSLDVKNVVTGISEGSRDEQLHRYAWHLKALGIDKGLALGFIEEAARRARPPFSADVAREKVERAYKSNARSQASENMLTKLKENGNG